MKYGKPDSRHRILVVEDYWLVAMQAQMMFEDCGCEVIGPVGTLVDASRLARDCAFSAALLDVNLGDDTSYPVADILARREIPFAFATGHDAMSLPAPYGARMHLAKPYDSRMVKRFLAEMGLKAQ